MKYILLGNKKPFAESLLRFSPHSHPLLWVKLRFWLISFSLLILEVFNVFGGNRKAYEVRKPVKFTSWPPLVQLNWGHNITDFVFGLSGW